MGQEFGSGMALVWPPCLSMWDSSPPAIMVQRCCFLCLEHPSSLSFPRQLVSPLSLNPNASSSGHFHMPPCHLFFIDCVSRFVVLCFAPPPHTHTLRVILSCESRHCGFAHCFSPEASHSLARVPGLLAVMPLCHPLPQSRVALCHL